MEGEIWTDGEKKAHIHEGLQLHNTYKILRLKKQEITNLKS